jgi:hypothetical protein
VAGRLSLAKRLSWARLLLLLVTMLVAVAISRHIIFNQGPLAQGVDFSVFKRASSDPVALVYRNPPPFAYPPTALIIMKPLTVLGYWFWIGLSAVTFAISAIVLSGRNATLSFLSPPAVKCLVHGQVAMLLAGLQYIGLIVPPFLGGILWGIAASVKPQLLLFAPLALLVRRDWLMLAGMSIGCLLMVSASLIFLDPALWAGWFDALINFNQIVQRGEMIRTIAPASAAVSAGLPPLPFVIAGLVIGTAAILTSAPEAQGVHLVALVTAASLVSSPYAHIYDAVALIPACVALMMRGRWIYAVPAGLIFMGTPLITIASMLFILFATFIETRFKVSVGWPVARWAGPPIVHNDAGPSGPAY